MAASYYRTGESWIVAYDGRLDGRPKRTRGYIYGLKTEAMARKAKAKKDHEEQLLRAGLLQVDPHAAQIRRAERTPIEKHIEAFRAAIVACGRTPPHARQQANHVLRLCRMASIASLSQLRPEAIQAAAKRLMDQEELAPRTANAAIKAARQFSTWCSVTNRLAGDVLHRRLTTFREEEDQRRRRRAMSQEEFDWLITTLLAGKDRNNRCGISRKDRAMLYQIGLGTGYRRSALLTLTPESFKVDARESRPAVLLQAKRNKKRRDREQPIRQDLAAAIRSWLKTKPPRERVFHARPHAELAQRFARDLAEARTAWIAAAASDAEKAKRQASNFLQYVYHDGLGNVWCDFHGLRHTGITFVVRAAGLKAGQIWADHSTPVLTAKYSHMDLTDEERALDALPSAVPCHSTPFQAPAQDLAHLGQCKARKGTKTASA